MDAADGVALTEDVTETDALTKEVVEREAVALKEALVEREAVALSEDVTEIDAVGLDEDVAEAVAVTVALTAELAIRAGVLLIEEVPVSECVAEQLAVADIDDVMDTNGVIDRESDPDKLEVSEDVSGAQWHPDVPTGQLPYNRP